jgi:hypothetical protein
LISFDLFCRITPQKPAVYTVPAIANPLISLGSEIIVYMLFRLCDCLFIGGNARLFDIVNPHLNPPAPCCVRPRPASVHRDREQPGSPPTAKDWQDRNRPEGGGWPSEATNNPDRQTSA